MHLFQLTHYQKGLIPAAGLCLLLAACFAEAPAAAPDPILSACSEFAQLIADTHAATVDPERAKETGLLVANQVYDIWQQVGQEEPGILRAAYHLSWASRSYTRDNGFPAFEGLMAGRQLARLCRTRGVDSEWLDQPDVLIEYICMGNLWSDYYARRCA